MDFVDSMLAPLLAKGNFGDVSVYVCVYVLYVFPTVTFFLLLKLPLTLLLVVFCGQIFSQD